MAGAQSTRCWSTGHARRWRYWDIGEENATEKSLCILDAKVSGDCTCQGTLGVLTQKDTTMVPSTGQCPVNARRAHLNFKL